MNPIFWPATYRWALYLALACAVAIAAEIWQTRAERRGFDKAQAEYANLALVASESARRRERDLQQQAKDAENEARQREKVILGDAAAVRSERDRLRGELGSSRGRMSSASADAVREYASTLSSVFEECAGSLEEMALSASGHASDSLMYQRGWPR